MMGKSTMTSLHTSRPLGISTIMLKSEYTIICGPTATEARRLARAGHQPTASPTHVIGSAAERTWNAHAPMRPWKMRMRSSMITKMTMV